MEEKRAAVILLFLIVAGLFLLGRGMTGLVVSESCCFGDNCSKENVCDAARLESPATIGFVSKNFHVGMFLILMAIALYVFMRNRMDH